ncbi:ABC transporter [endosymbiont of Acanthamoeba sp. UWC8]|uniref:ABC transporter permease n=1 Tax=endosymbiont of Acanthamoeba sp. UWC8 TaxID=86106 RepID=UPI0004D0B952|nr:ABC transporter permease [endosymbiont of Acanthamoeba sp. UWC8]AIF82011.1 ABC transporter [endosymbiont of Acanthamoeba sp. UWC8]
MSAGKLNLKQLMHSWLLIRELARAENLSQKRSIFSKLGWSFIEPIMTLVIYFFFIAMIRNQVINNPIHTIIVLFCGLTIYSWTNRLIISSCSSIINYDNILLTIPVHPLNFILVDLYKTFIYNFIPCFLTLSIFVIAIGEGISYKWIAIIPLIICMLILQLAVAIFCSVIGIYLKDLSNFLSQILRLLLFVSPIFFELSNVSNPTIKLFLFINPLAIYIEYFRNIIAYNDIKYGTELFIVFILSSILLFIAITFLNKVRYKIIKQF